MRESLSIFAAILAALINSYIAGDHYGFERGYADAARLSGGNDGMMFYGGSYYLAETHVYLAVVLAAYLGGRFFMRETISRVFCTVFIFLCIGIYLQWTGLMFQNSELTFVENLKRSTVLLDWISLALVVQLFIYQIFVLFVYRRRPDHRAVA